MSKQISNKSGEIASVASSSSAASQVVKSTACTNKKCVCKGERERLFNLINKDGIQKVVREHGDLLNKGRKEGWLGQKVYVLNCSGTWKAAGNKKRKRPTVPEFMEASKKRKELMSEQLKVFKSKVAELQLEIELQEAAQEILKLKAKKASVRAEVAE